MADFKDTFREEFVRIGLSTETKPTDDENGQMLYELDAQQYYVFYIDQWYPVD